MKVAIDSYCYHRYFGEVYPDLEQPPEQRMTVEDFLGRANAHAVQGVSIEHFMLADTTPQRVRQLRELVDASGFELVWAWGHPHGLGSGTRPEALTQLKQNVDLAVALGANVMRVCAGGRRTRPATWAEHKRGLLPLLQEAADYALANRVTLAVENHVDLLGDEMLELLTAVSSPALGVCLDTGNNLRMLEDPMPVIEKLAPYTKAVHLKDVTAFRGSPREFGFWPSVPLGRGLIDIPRALRALADAGYDGLLALEIDYLHPDFGDEEQAIGESLSYLRTTLASLSPHAIGQVPVGRNI
jgi:sugar phosphate isomerase/epimerase